VTENFKLKAYMLEQGIKISTEAENFLNNKSPIWLMKDYITCTGLTFVFDGEYATISQNQASKIQLILENNNLFIIGEGRKVQADVIIPPEYMKDEILIQGKSITNYVNTYTDRVRLQLSSGCVNKCKFCNAIEFPYFLNTKTGLEEALKIALKQSKIRHMLISSGSVKVEDLPKISDMYNYFGKNYSHLLPDVMMTPRGFDSYVDSSQYLDYIKFLKDSDIFGLSINMEINSEENLKRFCPEKFAIGQKRYLDFIEKAVSIFGKGKVRSLLIVGLEPLEETLKGVEKLAKIGCNPVLSPLFPYGEANTPPNAQLFIKARQFAEEICEKHGVELGPLCKPCSHNVL